MPAERDDAIVVRLAEYSETSQIVALFARDHGLVRLIAKGARRGTKQRFAPGFDLLERGDLQFVPPRGDASLGPLTDWRQRETYPGLRRDAPRLYGGFYAAELLTTLLEPFDPHPELFDKLLVFLDHLAGTGPPTALVARFQWRLLEAIGYAPNLRQCVDTDAPPRDSKNVYFSSQAGGLISPAVERNYAEKRRVPLAVLNTAPGTGDAYGWFELLDYHIRMLAGRALQSHALLEPVLRRLERGR